MFVFLKFKYYNSRIYLNSQGTSNFDWLYESFELISWSIKRKTVIYVRVAKPILTTSLHA